LAFAATFATGSGGVRVVGVAIVGGRHCVGKSRL
jgi:hypothetical protein